VSAAPEHYLREEYLKRLAKFESANPPAYRFMKRIELEGPALGMWLSTASSAHLYKADGFLAYFQLRTSGVRPPALVMSADFNPLIAEDAVNRSSLLFPRPIERMIMAQKGFSAKWAQVRGSSVELFANTPDAFYNALFETLQKFDAETAQA
jgi:hypothetical protein